MISGDTIAAIATAPGRGGVAIVRISGPEAWNIATKVTGRKIAEGDAGRFFRVKLPHDDGLMLVFKAPRSYTGEDAVELQGHGGSIAPKRVLQAAIAAGARLAERGEFTQRSFLNGKLDLTAAEGVIDLVDARTERAADDAAAKLAGGLSARCAGLYDAAIELSARCEHSLDVSEDEIPESEVAAIRNGCEELRKKIRRMILTANGGRLLRNGAMVVLAGEPNAGKSSLMNAMLGEKRVIVSDQAGTTRDSIEEGLEIDGWPIRLTDTAGLRQTADAAEAEGVQRAKALIGNAQVVVALDCKIEGAIAVHAKCDLGRADGVLNVSAKTGEGIEALKAAIAGRVAELAAKGDEETGSVTERQQALLEAAERALADANDDPVLTANRLREAAIMIGRVTGRIYTDDMLDSLFSRFCVGK